MFRKVVNMTKKKVWRVRMWYRSLVSGYTCDRNQAKKQTNRFKAAFIIIIIRNQHKMSRMRNWCWMTRKKKKFVTFLLFSIGILRSSNSCPKVTIPANFHAAIDEVRSWERFSKAQPCIPIVWFGLFRKLLFFFFTTWQRPRAAREVNWFPLAYSINFTSELERSTTKRPHFVQKSTRTRARDGERES